MYNPFKYTYKIVENSNINGDVAYGVRYGSFLCSENLDLDGKLWSDECWSLSDKGINFKNLNEVKEAIKKHEQKLLDLRLAQITTKTIARI